MNVNFSYLSNQIFFCQRGLIPFIIPLNQVFFINFANGDLLAAYFYKMNS